MTFLDTNVLVYAADDTDVAKHGRAYELVVRAIKGEAFMVSAQVLNEFAFVMYKKFKRTDDEIAAYLRFFGPIRTVSLEPQFSRRAIEIKVRYGLQYYDSLLLATAEANGCEEFCSEDLNDGQTYCGIKAVNPFILYSRPKSPIKGNFETHGTNLLLGRELCAALGLLLRQIKVLVDFGQDTLVVTVLDGRDKCDPPNGSTPFVAASIATLEPEACLIVESGLTGTP